MRGGDGGAAVRRGAHGAEDGAAHAEPLGRPAVPVEAAAAVGHLHPDKTAVGHLHPDKTVAAGADQPGPADAGVLGDVGQGFDDGARSGWSRQRAARVRGAGCGRASARHGGGETGAAGTCREEDPAGCLRAAIASEGALGAERPEVLGAERPEVLGAERPEVLGAERPEVLLTAGASAAARLDRMDDEMAAREPKEDATVIVAEFVTA